MSLRIDTLASGKLVLPDLTGIARDPSRRIDPAMETAFVARGAATANLHRLMADNALCVTTGQQPGLFTGPLYTIYKGLSAAALAQRLESDLGRPVVPVFWTAGDDHDFRESAHVNVLTVDHQIRTLTLGERPADAPQLPLYHELLGARIQGALQDLSDAVPDTEFKARLLEELTRQYAPHRDVATAFSGTLAELLGPYGIVVFQPYDAAAKLAAAPHIKRALSRAGEINDALARRAAELEGAGMPVPIQTGHEATTVMLEAERGRDRLILKDESYEARRSGEHWSLGSLERIAEEDPTRLSPNVLLRPVIEAAILPTVAYVAGPGEIAYLRQADPIYQILEVAPQHVVARWSGVILEQRVAKVLDRFGIQLDDLARPEGELEASLLRDEMPDNAVRALEELRRTIPEQYGLLATAAAELDPTLEKPVKSEYHNVMRRLAEIEKKLVGQLKKRNATVAGQLAKARISLFPLGRPQERVLNVIPYLARYGDELLEAVFERCTEWAAGLETAPGDT